MSAGRLVRRGEAARLWGVLSMARQPATTSGVAIYMCRLLSPHVATPRVAQYGVTHSDHPSGVGEMSASGHRLRRGGGEEAAVAWWR